MKTRDQRLLICRFTVLLRWLSCYAPAIRFATATPLWSAPSM